MTYDSMCNLVRKMILKGKRGTHAQIWHGAGDRDDSLGDWTAKGNEGATAAAALLPGLWKTTS